MVDEELEAIKRRKLLELQRRMTFRERERKVKVDDDNLLRKAFVGRAWEVYQAAKYQYPDAMRRVGRILLQLISTGRLRRIDGGQLYTFLRRLGLRVRLRTKIRIKEHGKLKTIAEKIKED